MPMPPSSSAIRTRSAVMRWSFPPPACSFPPHFRGGSVMPRLAANLSMMFNELPFLDRFAAARKAGFDGVEFLFPYEHPAAELRKRLDDAGLTQALLNMPPGDWSKGERGLASLPGRQSEFRNGVKQALDYAEALGCKLVHAMAGIVPAGVSPGPANRRSPAG